jgi:adenylate cyclase
VLVEGKLGITFTDLGEHEVKNIAKPVRVYRVELTSAPDSTGTAVTKNAISEKIAIAVLPFDNLSGDKEQEYFSDGITEDIITELSRFRELRVIARNSSFQFRGGKNDIRDVGRKLDAKFVIEGSIRRAANRIRITVQLIEAASQSHIWSDRYDREMVDVFEIQEEIARTIAIRVAGQARASTVENDGWRPRQP